METLFFGKHATVLSLHLKTASGSVEFRVNPALASEIDVVRRSLPEFLPNQSSVVRLPSGQCAHLYGTNTISCESLKLSNSQDFFRYGESRAKFSLPQKSTLNMERFLFVSDEEFAAAPTAWGWDKNVWITRFLQCIEKSSLLEGVTVIRKPEIRSLFPGLSYEVVRAVPFHGEADIFLCVGKSVAVIHIRRIHQ